MFFRKLNLTIIIIAIIIAVVILMKYSNSIYTDAIIVIIAGSIVFFVTNRTLKILDTLLEIKKIVERSFLDDIWILDVQTMKLSLISNTSQNLLGYTKEELAALNIEQILHPEDFIKLSEQIKSAIINIEQGVFDNETSVSENRLIHKDGSLIWIEIATLLRINTKTRKLINVIGITRQINKRKMFEEEIQEQNIRFKVITDIIDVAIWIVNVKDIFENEHIISRDCKYEFITAGITNILGYTVEEFYKLKRSDVIPYETMNTTMIYFEDLILGRPVPSNYETRELHKDGHLVWCESSIKLLRNKEGNPYQIIGVTRQIEEKKKLETSLKESEKLYRLVSENMNDTVWMVDINTLMFTFISANSIYTSGYAPDELVGKKTIIDLIQPSYAQELINEISQGIDDYKYDNVNIPHVDMDVIALNKYGEEIWVEISTTMKFDENGLFSEIVGLTRHIGDRKEAEMKIKEQQMELEMLNLTKDRFMSIIAHDLRNPLTALINVAEIFNSFYLSMSKDEIQNSIELLLKSSNHLHRLLNNLLQWTQSSTGHITYTPDIWDLLEIIEMVLNELKIQAAVKAIDINIFTPIDDINCWVICDINMITTVLRNLLSNSIKFSHRNSNIDVNISEWADDPLYVLVSVLDNGVGIPADKIDKLFKIGEKITTNGTNKEIGTGLGLILVKEFIDKHKCKIWVESAEGKGTTFFFILPRAKME